ncbi:MAG: cytochrome oxidase [Planctomycetes bacterium]|nr:cytochrome oxidase [Planctomycetota bacterium]NOG53539.1 cytochrome oxidase [Planctomycetota bacterium]
MAQISVQDWIRPVVVTTRGQQRLLVDTTAAKWHLFAGVTWIVLGIIAGLIYSLVFLRLYPHEGTEWLSFGRIRMMHTNLIAYGWLVNCFIGMMYWVVPRLTGEPVFNHALAKLILVVWNAIVAIVLVGIAMGHAQAIEWGETPFFTDHLIVLGVALVVVQFTWSIARSREKAMYVTLWYFTAGLVWTPLVYVMGNYLPEKLVPGTSGAALVGLFIHDLVGLFVTPMGWGLMYFFVPVIAKKPIYSHAISLVGFWGLAFFYPLNGVHHFLWSSIPMFAQYGAVISTIAVEIVVTTVVINFVMTMRGEWHQLRESLALRWFMVGMVNYFITCLQCAFQTTLTMQKLIHFTDWVVGHAHLVMFGVFSFWIVGVIEHLWPRLTGRAWWSRRLNVWHFWLWVVGVYLMFFDLMIVGVIQGISWDKLDPWADSIFYSELGWFLRTISGVFITLGVFCLFINMLMTMIKPTSQYEDDDYVDQLVDKTAASGA